ncbi:hypothetical protein FEM48_Zijuj01G0099700 [Ziziphus jujuba var. spinosa]|uniref:Transmembrane protein n=1 Tax=Ziziphus jujuba var. spinosa TaxID=714518 RepID=A0A978W0K9_ZIZJJ|nr:hypothetical protein FEM48_Zijuj01G0099700 [Ziziphus jujuba var. spinosa]
MANPRATVLIILVAVCLISIAGESNGRELRPSDHGLDFQESTPSGEKESPEMKSFFGGEGVSPTTNVALPKALNSTAPSWWSVGSDGGEKRDRVRQVLLVGSLVCGVTGVALLVASGLLYIFKYKKQKNSSIPIQSSSSPPINDSISK